MAIQHPSACHFGSVPPLANLADHFQDILGGCGIVQGLPVILEQLISSPRAFHRGKLTQKKNKFPQIVAVSKVIYNIKYLAFSPKSSCFIAPGTEQYQFVCLKRSTLVCSEKNLATCLSGKQQFRCRDKMFSFSQQGAGCLHVLSPSTLWIFSTTLKKKILSKVKKKSLQSLWSKAV